MPRPDAYEAFLDELTRLEAAEAVADETLARANEVFAPAGLETDPTSPAAGRPAEGKLAAVVAWAGGPDRLVTRPIWFLYAAARHLALAALAVALVLFGAALLSLLLRPVLPPVPSLLLAAPAAAVAVAGTLAHLWRSFRRELSNYPW